jgi:hypothetical protein
MTRALVVIALATLQLAAWTCPASAPSPEQSVVLFRDARVFDGKAAELTERLNVLVEGHTIAQISQVPISAARAIVIDANGRTLMPGLTDTHTHLMFEGLPQATALMADIGYVNFVAGQAAGAMLMRGFTNARDLGGPVFGLNRAIDGDVSAMCAPTAKAQDVLPEPPPPFKGIIGQTIKESKADYPKPLEAPAGPPSVPSRQIAGV